MIECQKCHHRNDDDAQFCAACGEYLGYSGRKVEEAPPDAGERYAEPEPVLEDDADAAEPEPEPETGLQPLQPPDGPVEGEIRPLTPDDEYVREIPQAPPPPPPPPPSGDVVCPHCRWSNDRSANFCRKCGQALAQAPIAPRLAWWRRILRRRDRPAVPAGERPGRRADPHASAGRGVARRARSRIVWARRALVIASVLVVALGAAAPPIRNGVSSRFTDLYTSVRRALFPRYAPVIVASSRATSALPGHPAGAAFDKILTTFWAEGARHGNGKGQKLVAFFGRAVDLGKVDITAGDQASASSFVKEPIPHQLRFRAFRHGKLLSTKDVTLEETRGVQQFKLSGSRTTRVVITIVSVYPSQSGHAASLSEVEFFEKQ